MNIIKYKYLFFLISGSLVIASVFSISYFGFKQGIDFVGGTLWEIRVEKTIDKSFIQDLIPEAIVNSGVNNSWLLRLPEMTEEAHQEKLYFLQDKLGSLEELKFESIGPAIGKEVRTRAIWALASVLLAISLYIAFAFRKVSYPVTSWKYGIITLVTLFHDAIIPAGLIAFLGYIGTAEANTNFVIAILVVIGFSVHDTIVVFDRIRENLRLKLVKDETFSDLVNRSINETLARSINTSLTLVLILTALYFLGSLSLSYFVLVILVGTIIGTYSSICIASPLLTLLKGRGNI